MNPAKFAVCCGPLWLAVNGSALAVDPVQEAYLKASNPGALVSAVDPGDGFGFSMAISGDTLVVGALFEDSSATVVNGNEADNSATSSGAAYVFVRTPSGWQQQAYLKPSNTGSEDRFGVSVAISGDTIVVGANGEDSAATGLNGNGADNTAAEAGAAYVFVRNGTTWSQQAYLKASNTDADDAFGDSVAIDGNTVVVGSILERSASTGVNGSQADNTAVRAGAAYVFVRNGMSWSQQAYLKASNTEEGDEFGGTVAICGDTVIVGAPSEDSGAAVVNGNQADNSINVSGAAYVFVRNGMTWSQQAYLKPFNPGFDHAFGRNIAISGNTAVLSSPFEQSDSKVINSGQNDTSLIAAGAVYVFVRNGTTWSQQAYLKPWNTDTYSFSPPVFGLDTFGFGLDIEGDTVIVGAWEESSDQTGVFLPPFSGDNENRSASGSAYIFRRTGTQWSLDAYLKADNAGEIDLFGGSAVLSGDIAVFGAEGEDSSAPGINGNGALNDAQNSGAAYAFRLNLGLRLLQVTGTELNGHLFTIRFKGPACASAWRVKGSANLAGFSDDKTADSTITETSLGNYEAVVDVSGEGSPYYLRIER